MGTGAGSLARRGQERDEALWPHSQISLNVALGTPWLGEPEPSGAVALRHGRNESSAEPGLVSLARRLPEGSSVWSRCSQEGTEPSGDPARADDGAAKETLSR